jgi:hypothetical protein
MSHRRLQASAIVASCVVAAIAASGADVLAQLGLTREQGQQIVADAVVAGRVDHSVAAAAFKAAPPALRARLAEGAIAWAKAYTSSAEFAASYAAVRDANKPAPPQFDGTPEDEVQQQIDLQTKAIEKSRADMAAMDPEVRRTMEAAANQAAAAVRQLDTPEMRRMQLAGVRHARDAATARHADALQQWQVQYPENPARATARRLRAFLEVSATVDFDAALESRGGRARFVNPAYERQTAEWKLCFRAGRETVEAARAAASAWLAEIEAALDRTAPPSGF